MSARQAPGVYFEPRQPQATIGSLVRTDIAAFIGYAQQGPTDLPIRLASMRQFSSVFGEPMAPGYLGAAVRAFFENGGDACYVLRITDASAAAAGAGLDVQAGAGAADSYRWRFSAAFNLTSILLAAEFASDRPDSAALLATSRIGGAVRAPNPGFWGNGLTVTVTPSSALRTATIPGLIDEGFTTAVESVVGLEEFSLVELRQDTRVSILRIDRMDPARLSVTWQTSLRDLGFDMLQPIQLESIEFDLRVTQDAEVLEQFDHLAPHPEHSRALLTVINRSSNFIDLELERPPAVAEADVPWQDPNLWPDGAAVLSGGVDGLENIAAEHYIAALATLAKVDEVSILAAPDLVLNSAADLGRTPLPRAVESDCHDLSPPLTGTVFGRVVTIDAALADPVPVANVTVTHAAGSLQTTTNPAGEFRLSGVSGFVTLRFERAGFEVEELQTRSLRVEPALPTEFFLQRLLLPGTLATDDVLAVQLAMTNPAIAGPYRIALLDPPAAEMKLAEIRSWRARLGDAQFGVLFYPWVALVRRERGVERMMQIPPSGHAAGLFARADRADGPHRAPANLAMREVKRVTVPINDIDQGLLNPSGVNAIRSFPGRGIRLFGARTLSSDAEWRFVTVRRFILALEKTLEKSLQWVVFEPNDVIRRQAVSFTITALLERLWRGGALMGNSPDAAFRVKCDDDNNPQAVRDAGRFIVDIAVAPSVPFEFIVFRIGQTLDAIEVTE